MKNETAIQNGTGETISNGANGHVTEETMEPRQTTSRPAVQFLTDEDADRAAEEVFRFHRPLLAELAK